MRGTKPAPLAGAQAALESGQVPSTRQTIHSSSRSSASEIEAL